MTQEIDGEGHQITHSGDIKVINCHWGATCPYRDTPESQRQAEFERAAGIWCEPRARELLEGLMRDCGFTARELGVAWRAGSVAWDAKKARFVIRAPLIEALFTWLFVALMLVYYLLIGVPALFTDRAPTASVLVFFVATTLYLGGAWLAGRFVLWPRRVALRVRRILAAQ